MEKIKKYKAEIIHIALIILGIIFVSLGAFHTNIWFDESYSIALTNHSFMEIWTIGGHDVHPILYYWLLKIVRIIFGNNIMIYKLFSVLPIAILSILGFTHIRKDFGKKVALLFSFFVSFLPITSVYGVEIRMYSWAMLVVTLMAIYAYRIINNTSQKNIKNWIIFAIFSLASAYTHYYGLIIAGITNLFLFIYLIIQSRKEKKITINLKNFIISAIIQILIYIPWLVFFIKQVGQVSGGFWIGFHFPETIIEALAFPFTGNLGSTLYVQNWIAIAFTIMMFTYALILILKNKNKINIQPAKYAIIAYFIVILMVIVVSTIMGQVIFYARYMSVLTGLLIFFFSYIIAKLGNKYGNIVICILTLALAIAVNVNLLKINYDTSNTKPINYIKENIQEKDIFVYENDGAGFVVTANFPENTTYFWDRQNWGVGEAYKAYTPYTVYNLDDLKDYKGRIWAINSNSYNVANLILSTYDTTELIEQKEFKTRYQNYEYTFSLIEKK